jgi:hypothetical protein
VTGGLRSALVRTTSPLSVARAKTPLHSGGAPANCPRQTSAGIAMASSGSISCQSDSGNPRILPTCSPVKGHSPSISSGSSGPRPISAGSNVYKAASRGSVSGSGAPAAYARSCEVSRGAGSSP